MSKPKRKKSKKKHSKHSKSELERDPSKVAKKRKKQSKEKPETIESHNSEVSFNSTNSNGYNALDNSLESLNSSSDQNRIELAKRKEGKHKKTPKKRDSIDKPMTGILKKQQSRRQFTSICAIMECIESVVRGTDVSLPETISDDMVKPKCVENATNTQTTSNSLLNIQNTLFNMKPDPELLENNKSQTLTSQNSILNNEIKSKPRKKSSTPKEKDVLHMGKIDPNIMNESSAMNALMVKTTTKKLYSSNQIKLTKIPSNATSMKKMKLIKC